MDPDDEALEFTVPTLCAGTAHRNERLDLTLGGVADLNDEMSERGRDVLERYSVVPSILLPPHTPFSPSPLPFRLVLIRSQHILSGPWKPTHSRRRGFLLRVVLSSGTGIFRGSVGTRTADSVGSIYEDIKISTANETSFSTSRRTTDSVVVTPDTVSHNVIIYGTSPPHHPNLVLPAAPRMS